jgi:hypothetical protein
MLSAAGMDEVGSREGAGRQAAATASARRRAGLEGHGGEDAGDGVGVEDE